MLCLKYVRAGMGGLLGEDLKFVTIFIKNRHLSLPILYHSEHVRRRDYC